MNGVVDIPGYRASEKTGRAIGGGNANARPFKNRPLGRRLTDRWEELPASGGTSSLDPLHLEYTRTKYMQR